MDSGETYSELEDQLLKENFVTVEEVAFAKKTRRENLARAQKPLGLLLADIANIPQDAFNGLLNDKRTQEKIAFFGLQKGILTREQVDACRPSGDPAGDPLGTVLVEKGYLSQADRDMLLQLALEEIGFAKAAIAGGLIAERDLERALRVKSHQRTVCEILYHRNLVTLSELNHLFRKLSRDVKLGQILLLQGLLSDAQIQAALDEQSVTTLSLGKVLLKRRHITVEQLYFALSIQFNTPFQKLDGYVYYEKQKASLRGVVGQAYALENRILPLFQNGNILTLAVSNPADIWSMHGLKPLYPDLQMTCVLITDEKFSQLYAMLYGEMLSSAGAHRPVQTGAATPDQTLLLNHPAAQKAVMQKLYEEYRYYQDTVGLKAVEGEETLFYSFIEAQHQQICDQYRCQEVLFRFEVKSGRTEILASPVI